MDNEDKYVILRTYSKAWKIDRRIYSIEGVKLWFPISTTNAFYFSISMVTSIVLINIVPFYNNLNWIIKFGLVPYLLMKFLTKQKLDGKPPHKFFIDYLVYYFGPKKYNRFSSISTYHKVIKFKKNIPYRSLQAVDKTDMVLKKNKGWRR